MKRRRRDIAVNRQAFFNYEVLERFEAGLQLTGTEIKSIRAARVDLRGSHARFEDNELWLHGMHVALYDPAGQRNHDPKRPRKLLMRRSEIAEICGQNLPKGPHPGSPQTLCKEPLGQNRTRPRQRQTPIRQTQGDHRTRQRPRSPNAPSAT